VPHARKRFLQPIFDRLLNAAPIIGILGQRQTGKTTFVTQNCKNYVSLDDSVTLNRAQSDPTSFIEDGAGTHSSPFAIDECQLAPELFPALKDSVRKHPGRGRFILTGSVRFTSRKAIRESLTGRILNLELLPMTLRETLGMPHSQMISKILESKKVVPLLASSKITQHQMDTYLERGGLPGICFLRDEFARNRLFETHLETLLERDLKLVLQTTLGYRTLRGLLEVLALTQGEPVEFAELGRRVGISVVTLKRLISALEAIFLIRVLPTEGGGRKSVIFFEDQGQASHLAENRYGARQRQVASLFSAIRGHLHYQPELNARAFQYRARGGAFVPLAWHTRKGTFGVLPILEKRPGKSALGSARSFIKAYPGSRVIIAHAGAHAGARAGHEIEFLDRSILLMPVVALG
jgi:predicted AAA+ superfamily ATPase